MLTCCPRPFAAGGVQMRPILSALLLGSILLAIVLGGTARAQVASDSQVPIRAADTADPATSSTSDSAGLNRGIRPFGANLWDEAVPRTPGPNDSYRLQPGDTVSIKLFGAVNQDETQQVDGQGNVFISNVGPVAVAGLPSSALNQRLRQAVRQQFVDTVDVYATLQSAQSIGLFVTGEVIRPGRYLGLPADSALFFLSQAGGVNPETGSYRDIRVIRGDREIAAIDLYEFLLEGRLPSVTFREGDTILVKRRGPIITVLGDVTHTAQFEFVGSRLSGAEVNRLARPRPSAANVAIDGARYGAPFNDYLDIRSFENVAVADGDTISYSADAIAGTIFVRIEGPVSGPKTLSVARDAKLTEVLAHIAVDPETVDLTAIHLKRESVAREQKQSLQDSLARLQRSALTAMSATDSISEIRVNEAQLIMDYVQTASLIEPEGRVVVVDRSGTIRPIAMEEGDIIIIPPASDVILVTGEVVIPQALVWEPGIRIRELVQAAGGYTERADEGNAVVIRRNGSVVTGLDVVIRPGDEVLILPAVEFKGLQLAKDLSQIVFQIAATAGTVFSILNN